MDKGIYEELQAGIDAAWLTRILQEMVLIRSENPFNDPPRPGFRELEMADYLSCQLAALGVRHEVHEVRPDRPNVFGYLPGSEGGTTLALAGHIDTAQTVGYHEAYDVRLEDGRLYGRGACDMKAGLAAYLAVARLLGEAKIKLRGNLCPHLQHG